MPPVVMESPAINMHHPALSSISRIQQFSPSTASDHTRHDQALLTSPSLQHSDTLQQQLNARSGCANCDSVNTPLWKRDFDGKSICNACGEYAFHLISFSNLLACVAIYSTRTRVSAWSGRGS
ncbi:hypothetical protein SERLA73DRAFT_61122 [Serpula lacrymans var. lacrymans S7.3]|uniref:GATA-type domain-containing protein n=1 Tax=Serpula lacrymans var. lacrymans (strain S7.3) TaxID=936435 RepID=F8Q9E3_SERL3|nr:hypothetical protein SERLA73DRAFT_61122 [Serpula lacrymans var. lacrymans S7.3]